jgi:hypothetical protein
MKIGDYRVWRSPAVCWCAFAFFAVFTVLLIVVDVRPYPGQQRDRWLSTLGSGAAALGSFLAAVRAAKNKG